jgi:O-antigen ligase
LLNQQSQHIDISPMFKNIHLPFIIWIVVLSTLIASIGGQFLNYQIAGFGWFIPLILSILIYLKTPGRIKFPILIWLPWIFVVIIYFIFSETPNAFQRSAMLLCPIIIGASVSKQRIGELELESFNNLYRSLAVAFYMVIIFKAGIIFTGVLPERTGLAAEAMTGALLCSLFASSYVLGRKKDLAWWAAFAAIPFIALTRTGIVAAGLTLPLTFAPMKIFKRIVLISLVVLLSIPIFYSERVQHKMFYSGSGTFAEVHPDNPDLATSGRTLLWEQMEDEIGKKPYFGHGANASEPFVSVRTGGLTHPHNDWLRLLYEYGYFGTVIFAFCLIAQVLHILKRAKSVTGETKTLFYAAAATFISFVLFMFSDNIILYVAFFGNLQFTIVGLAYAAYSTSSATDKREAAIAERRVKYRIRW